jgi:hypothetical protein
MQHTMYFPHKHGFCCSEDPQTVGPVIDTPTYCSPEPHDWIWRHYHVTSLAQLFSSSPSLIYNHTTSHKLTPFVCTLLLNPWLQRGS